MTIEELANELADGAGSYNRSKAVQLHTRTVAIAATSIESVIQDLDLLNRGPEAIDPAEILRTLADYAASDSDAQLLRVLAGATNELRQVAQGLPDDQAALLREVLEPLQAARSVADLQSILAGFENHQIQAVVEGASYARDILSDGKETIYNPESSAVAAVAGDPDDPPHDRNRRAVLTVAVDDAAGGVAGAAAGAFFLGVGALPGAVTGAVGNSVLTVASRALKGLLRLT